MPENTEAQGVPEPKKQEPTKKFEQLSPIGQAKALLAVNNRPMEIGVALALLPTPLGQLQEQERNQLLHDLEENIWTPEKGWRKTPPPPADIPRMSIQRQDPVTGNFIKEEVLEPGHYKTKQYEDDLWRIRLDQIDAKQQVKEGKKLYWVVDPEKTLEELGIAEMDVLQYTTKTMTNKLFGGFFDKEE